MHFGRVEDNKKKWDVKSGSYGGNVPPKEGRLMPMELAVELVWQPGIMQAAITFPDLM